MEELARWVFKSFHPGGVPVPPEVVAKDVKKLTARLDKDGDGKLSFDEFSKWFTHTCKKIAQFRRRRAQRDKREHQQAQAPKTDTAGAKVEPLARRRTR